MSKDSWKVKKGDGKSWDYKDLLDQKLRRTFHTGMIDRVRFKIEFRTGFELFNTRPYHNYETWSSGYYAKIAEEDAPNVEAWQRTVCAEDLDVLVDRICKVVEKSRQAEEAGKEKGNET